MDGFCAQAVRPRSRLVGRGTMREDLARASARCIRVLPRASMTQAIGWLSERPIPGVLRAPLLGGLAHAFGMDTREAERPLAEYATFQQLFCRRLAEGARPCTATAFSVASPVDGRFVVSGTLRSDSTFQVKGRSYSSLSLLGNDRGITDRFTGGAYAVLYLSPRDYHRMHSPVTGSVVGYRWIPGELWPVNDLVPFLPDVYCENERVITLLETVAGLVAMVKVAALGVGYISLSFLGEEAGVRLPPGVRPPSRDFAAAEAPRLRCGDEIAAFGLGSTVVLLFQAGRVRLEVPADGRVVRVGMRLGELVRP